MSNSPNIQNFNITVGDRGNVNVAPNQDKSRSAIYQQNADPALFQFQLEQLLNATQQEPSPPTELRREIRNLLSDIEDDKIVPANLMERLLSKIPSGLALSDNSTTIINNIRQLWQSAFGAGI